MARARVYAATGDAFAAIPLDAPGGARLSLEGSGARCLAVDPRDADRVYVGTFDDGVRVTDDGGDTWRKAPLDDPRVLSLAVSRAHEVDGRSVAYAGTEPSNLYRAEDGGRTWRVLPALRELPSEPRWSFPGRPWTHHVRTIALHPTDPHCLVVGIELGGVMRSTDGGATWTDRNPQALSDAHQLLTHPLAPDRIYEAAGGGIALSEDRGVTWSSREVGLDRRYAWAAAIDPVDPDLWYVSLSRGPFAAHSGGDGEARVVRSAGDGWTAIDDWGDEPELRRMPYALATVPERPGTVLAGLRGGVLLISEDAGDTWRRLGVELPDVVELVAAA
jgi:photosystem II stability/assembly factor-like uncharacterized protein